MFLSSPRWIFISCLIGFLDASREVLHKKMQKVMLYVLWLYDTSMTNINSNMTLLRVRNHYTVIYNKKILLDMRYDEPLYPSIQRSLEWPFSELFYANVSLWNQYKYIVFNIFSRIILIISYKMLIITEISNEKTSELNIYGVLCRNFKAFYQLELDLLFLVQEKLKV